MPERMERRPADAGSCAAGLSVRSTPHAHARAARQHPQPPERQPAHPADAPQSTRRRSQPRTTRAVSCAISATTLRCAISHSRARRCAAGTASPNSARRADSGRLRAVIGHPQRPARSAATAPPRAPPSWRASERRPQPRPARLESAACTGRASECSPRLAVPSPLSPSSPPPRHAPAPPAARARVIASCSIAASARSAAACPSLSAITAFLLL
jgi:hypothetical protein